MNLFNDGKNVTNVDSFSCFDENNNIKEESKEDVMDLIFILDKSGSMYDLVEDTIGGYNSYIERERAKGENILVTLVLFDTEYKMLYSRKPIEEVEKLTSKEYFADGCTALLDAVGRTIVSFDKELKGKVLCVITTDGLENASKEFSKDQVKDLIESRDWEFLFIGANIDSYGEAFTLGIDDDHAANYEACARGVSALFDSVENYRDAYSRDEHEDAEWKEGLD
ncbi:VWA domain-containing protein [Methanobrevibacter millerae]|uniref:von Willebrand factor type A domain-containing protein n=1 Tax=Methanobrevibacter millerae TaxID=230361 RepID=A0A1G5VV16_9EURY|nr:VWA domain-containing protein [Methanobrevibacter millerae]SDA49266.1 hypothetical protein SAMN02910315_00902 [Methanobrevibacter millerae]